MVKSIGTQTTQNVDYTLKGSGESPQAIVACSGGGGHLSKRQIAFMFIPVVGWAYGLYKLVQFFNQKVEQTSVMGIPDDAALQLQKHLKAGVTTGTPDPIELMSGDKTVKIHIRPNLQEQPSKGNSYGALSISGGISGTIYLARPLNQRDLEKLSVEERKMILKAALDVQPGKITTVHIGKKQ